MANAFNDFFTKIGPELNQEISKTKSNRDPTIYLNSRVTSSFLIVLLIVMKLEILFRLWMILNPQELAIFLQNC